jgi:menaquinone-9 beta-reductase
MIRNWDVAVIGAGPAGSASAAILADLGYRVILMDRAHFPRPKACAEYMSPGVLDALTDLGMAGCFLRAGPKTVPGMEIVTPRGARLRVDYQSGDQLRTAFTLPRAVLDAALVGEAARRGVEVWEGFVARSAVVEAGAVRGVTGMVSGKEVRVSAAVTVIADGGRSVLARSLGVARRPRWPVRLGLVAHYEGEAELQNGYGQMHVDTDGYCGVAPLPQDRFNVAMVVTVGAPGAAHRSPTEYFDWWIAAHPRLAAVLRRCRRIAPVRGIGPVGARSRRSWAPGALLVGDAATFFDPFTGEGIYRALRGARLAAEVVDMGLCKGDVTGETLSRYETARRRAFGRKEALTSLVQLFVQYPRLLEYAVPRLGRRERPRRTLGLVLGDAVGASAYLRPVMLWETLRP